MKMMMIEKFLTDAEKGVLALLRLKQRIASSSSSIIADACSIDLGRKEIQTTRKTKSPNTMVGKKRKIKAEEDIEGVVATTNKQKSSKRITHKAQKMMRIQKAQKRRESVPLPPPPPLPPVEYVNKITDEMGGTNIQLVIQKYLTKTDVTEGQDRLSIVIKKIQAQDFLTNEEKEFLKTRKPENNKSWSDIEIGVIDVNLKLQKKPLQLRKWVSGKSPIYVLGTHWKKLVKDNQLKENDIIQVWSFRVDTKLHFALVKVTVPQQQQQQQQQ